MGRNIMKWYLGIISSAEGQWQKSWSECLRWLFLTHHLVSCSVWRITHEWKWRGRRSVWTTISVCSAMGHKWQIRGGYNKCLSSTAMWFHSAKITYNKQILWSGLWFGRKERPGSPWIRSNNEERYFLNEKRNVNLVLMVRCFDNIFTLTVDRHIIISILQYIIDTRRYSCDIKFVLKLKTRSWSSEYQI